MWSDVVQVRTARRREGTPQGRGFYGSRHPGTGLGDVGEKWTPLASVSFDDSVQLKNDLQ
jgi:hypothetical protein